MTDDRRFSRNKFSTFKFGASSSDAILAWGIEVDWDGDSFFNGENEAKYMVGFRGYRGRPRYINRDGKGFERLLTGRYTITLDNATGRYDAWNTSSPLYPNVKYGKDVRIRVRSWNTGTLFPVFYGVLENIEPINNPDGERYVILSVVDGWQYLRNYKSSYPMKSNISPEQAIGYVLDSVNWPNRWGRVLSSTGDAIRYWWSDGNKQASSIIEDLAESFLGYVYIDASGSLNYKSRGVIGSAVSDISGAILLKDLSLPQPWEYSRNVTRIKVHPRTASASGIVYSISGTKPSIQNLESLTIFANYTYNSEQVPAANVTISGFAANTQENGGGVDKTAQCTAVLTDFGSTGKVVISNNSGGIVYLVTLELSGNAIYEPSSADVVYQSPGYETMPREFVLDLAWNQDVNVAVDFSGLVGNHISELHPYPVIQIENRPDEQFTPDLFDIVSLTIPSVGIYGDTFVVGYIEHQSLGENCQSVITKFVLESYITLGGAWIWDADSVFDTSVFGA